MNKDQRALVERLHYMAKQYTAGQYARGGGIKGPHYLDEAADTIESLRARIEVLEGALSELVALKDLKQALSDEWDRCWKNDQLKQWKDGEYSARQADYMRRKPLAWDAARAALQAKEGE